MSTASESAAFPRVAAAGGRLRMAGILFIVLGVVALLAPLAAGLGIAMLFGALVLVAGISRCLFAGAAGSIGGTILQLLVGVAMIVGGIVLMTHPMHNLAALTLLLAIYFGVVGIMEIVAGVRARPARGWGFAVFAGVISLLLGLLAWMQWPYSGAWLIGTLLGVQLVLTGVEMFAVGGVVKRVGGR